MVSLKTVSFKSYSCQEWPLQKPNTNVPSVHRDAQGEMVDIGEGDIIGSDDEGEAVVQGATSRSETMGAFTCQRRTVTCF